jgi:hypothetical protein
MDPGGIPGRLDEGASCAECHRDGRSVNQIENFHGVADHILQIGVSRDAGDRPNIDVRMSHREHDGQGVVPAGVNVEQYLMSHDV